MFLPALIGYFLGAIPTANLLASLVGIDLRTQGSGNPGTNNALRLGGPGLAASVLLTEMAKGATATLIGGELNGDPGMVIAGLAAVTGNLYNIFYRFKGGKGLGISAGVLFVAWPTVVIPAIAVIALAAWITQSSDGATVIAIFSLSVMAGIWILAELPTGWGIENDRLLLALGVGLGLLIWPKHQSNVRFKRPSPA